MKILVIAPHQDDEILSSYHYIKQQLQNGAEIKIVFVTNGDYQGPTYAKYRYFESTTVLKKLGLPLDSIYYMGYADTGMRLEKSFLYRLYNASDDAIQQSPFSYKTYHPVGEKTLHAILYGQEAFYTRRNLLADLKNVIYYFNPDTVVLPSQYDFHGDHKAVNYFMNDIFQKDNFHINVMYYLIHGGNDQLWPNFSNKAYLQAKCIPKALWEQRIIIPANAIQRLEKNAAIQKFESQHPNNLNAFLLRFAKEEEFFLNV